MAWAIKVAWTMKVAKAKKLDSFSTCPNSEPPTAFSDLSSEFLGRDFAQAQLNALGKLVFLSCSIILAAHAKLLGNDSAIAVVVTLVNRCADTQYT